jgi:hypothetical protein
MLPSIYVVERHSRHLLTTTTKTYPISKQLPLLREPDAILPYKISCLRITLGSGPQVNVITL